MAVLGSRGGAAGASELRLRTVSALALAAIALLTAWTGGWPLAAFWGGAGTVIAIEWLAMTGAQPARGLGIVAVAGIPALEWAFLARLDAGIVLVLGAVVIATVVLAVPARDRLWALAGFGYAAAVAIAPVAMRGHPAGGIAGLLWMFAVVWATDIAAYFTGRALGGPKIWPAVSPRKTWSGFAGGLLGGMLAGLAVAAIALQTRGVLPFGLIVVALASAVASVASQLGDFMESAMKRRFGVKDSGTLIPGHGGAMDRLDGFAAVALLVLAGLGAAAFAARGAAS